MSDLPLNLLVDQNIPQEVASWIRQRCPTWKVSHVEEVGLSGRPDPQIFRWAQANQAIVVTYDEDFADTRSFPLGSHFDWTGSLIIVDREKIRLRKKP